MSRVVDDGAGPLPAVRSALPGETPKSTLRPSAGGFHGLIIRELADSLDHVPGNRRGGEVDEGALALTTGAAGLATAE